MSDDGLTMDFGFHGMDPEGEQLVRLLAGGAADLGQVREALYRSLGEKVVEAAADLAVVKAPLYAALQRRVSRAETHEQRVRRDLYGGLAESVASAQTPLEIARAGLRAQTFRRTASSAHRIRHHRRPRP